MNCTISMATESPDIDLGNTYLYHQLDEYPWDQDQEFQSGLQAILGSIQDPSQVEHLTLRAKCYYFARKAGTQVDFDGYKQWVEIHRGNAPTNGTRPLLSDQESSVGSAAAESGGSGMGGMGDAPRPASFAEICEMIAEGKPIPGIKEIPDTILEGQASESSTEKRKKPWEKETGTGAEEKPSWMG